MRAGQNGRVREQKLEQLSLQLAIAFFAFQVVAWAGVCLYLRAARQRRRNELPVIELVTDVPAVAQAA